MEAAEKQVANARQQATKDNVSTQADIQTSRLAAESARANVAKADAGTSRSQSFQQQLLAQKSLVDAAQAELQSAQLQLQDTELRSPVDGFVSERQLDPGPLFEGDAYAADDLPRVPGSLNEAIEIFDSSDFLREALTSEVVEHLAHFGRAEQKAFEKGVTDFEKARYFERV